MRTSPLAKTYGWGIHYNQEGKMALIVMESQSYIDFSNNDNIKKVKAMKTLR